MLDTVERELKGVKECFDRYFILLYCIHVNYSTDVLFEGWMAYDEDTEDVSSESS